VIDGAAAGAAAKLTAKAKPSPPTSQGDLF